LLLCRAFIVLSTILVWLIIIQCNKLGFLILKGTLKIVCDTNTNSKMLMPFSFYARLQSNLLLTILVTKLKTAKVFLLLCGAFIVLSTILVWLIIIQCNKLGCLILWGTFKIVCAKLFVMRIQIQQCHCHFLSNFTAEDCTIILVW
jgi:hypothetical protein